MTLRTSITIINSDRVAPRYGQGTRRTENPLGIFEIILFLIVALIVIPPDDFPQVMRAVGKVLRELRLASNTVMREISGAIGDDLPFNILPPRFDDPHPTPPASSPPPPAFLAPEVQSQLAESAPAEAAPAPPAEAASAPQGPVIDAQAAAQHSEQQTIAGYQVTAEHQPASELRPSPVSAPPAPTAQPKAPEHPERSGSPADKP